MKLISIIHRFHRNEEGFETAQVVLLLAFTAVVMVSCATVGKNVAAWMQSQWSAFQGIDLTG